MKPEELTEGDSVTLHGHQWKVLRVRPTRKGKIELWVARGNRTVRELLAPDTEVTVPREQAEVTTMDVPSHRHEWTTLWSHFGAGMAQDVHFHPCLDDDCYHMLVGPGRGCNGVLNNHSHEHGTRLQKYRISQGPPRGDTITKEEGTMPEQTDLTQDRPKKPRKKYQRKPTSPQVLELLTRANGAVVYIDDIVAATGLDEKQIQRVFTNIRVRDLPGKGDFETVVPGRAWRWTGDRRLTREAVPVVEPPKLSVVAPPVPKGPLPSPPPLPKVPTPAEVAEEFAQLERDQEVGDERRRSVDPTEPETPSLGWREVGTTRSGALILEHPDGRLGRWTELE